MKHLVIILLLTVQAKAKEVRIAVLDSGLTSTPGVNLCQPIIDLTNTTPDSEIHHHGDNVTHIIADGLTNYCIIEIKIWSMSSKISENLLSKAIYESIRLNADIINISGGGDGVDAKEEAAIRYAEFRHVIVVSAAGNDGENLTNNCYYYPACYPSVVAIGNLHVSGNYGAGVDYYMRGVNVTAGGVTLTGTSQAAAMFTHKLAKKMSKVISMIADNK